jgi:hypothetical protein
MDIKDVYPYPPVQLGREKSPEMPGSLNNFVMIHKLAVSTRCKESWLRDIESKTVGDMI